MPLVRLEDGTLVRIPAETPQLSTMDKLKLAGESVVDSAKTQGSSLLRGVMNLGDMVQQGLQKTPLGAAGAVALEKVAGPQKPMGQIREEAFPVPENESTTERWTRKGIEAVPTALLAGPQAAARWLFPPSTPAQAGKWGEISPRKLITPFALMGSLPGPSVRGVLPLKFSPRIRQ